MNNVLVLLCWQIFSLAGLTFFDFLAMFLLKQQLKNTTFKNTKGYAIIINCIWASLLFINLRIFEFAMTQPYYVLQPIDINHFLWANGTLKLALVLYFLFMVPRIAPMLISFFAVGVMSGYFFHLYRTSLATTAIFLTGMVLFVATTFLIYKKKKFLIDHFSYYLPTIILYSFSWHLMFLSLGSYSLATICYKAIKFIVIMTAIHFVNVYIRKNVAHYLKIEDEINNDFLTQIYNRNAFETDFLELFSKESTMQMNFAMLDIDHFKVFNDHYGHLIGDKVLREVSQLSKNLLIQQGGYGKIYRVGGEEFGIIYQNISKTQAVESLVAICEAISEHKILSGKQALTVTVSAGLSTQLPKDLAIRDLYNRVDNYLYHSKEHGRKIITFEGELLEYHYAQG
jgi:diguanylate cyclase (GGDEF)-like protein